MQDEQEAITFRHDPDANIHNTSRKLTINASYDRLVSLFGEPEWSQDDDNPVQAHWAIDFSDGEVLTIYDWKESQPVEGVTQWNVGGHNMMAASRIYNILAGKPIEN